MKYRVIVPSRVRRAIAAFPENVRQRVSARIRDLAAEPRPPDCIKLKGTDAEYRIRVGDYRVRYDINDAAREVNILRCGHRGNFYRE